MAGTPTAAAAVGGCCAGWQRDGHADGGVERLRDRKEQAGRTRLCGRHLGGQGAWCRLHLHGRVRERRGAEHDADGRGRRGGGDVRLHHAEQDGGAILHRDAHHPAGEGRGREAGARRHVGADRRGRGRRRAQHSWFHAIAVDAGGVIAGGVEVACSHGASGPKSGAVVLQAATLV